MLKKMMKKKMGIKSLKIKSIKMGTILTWNPTGELFKVTGYNELRIKDGTAIKVTGIECDDEGWSHPESMPSIYNLNKSSLI